MDLGLNSGISNFPNILQNVDPTALQGASGEDFQNILGSELSRYTQAQQEQMLASALSGVQQPGADLPGLQDPTLQAGGLGLINPDAALQSSGTGSTALISAEFASIQSQLFSASQVNQTEYSQQIAALLAMLDERLAEPEESEYNLANISAEEMADYATKLSNHTFNLFRHLHQQRHQHIHPAYQNDQTAQKVVFESQLSIVIQAQSVFVQGGQQTSADNLEEIYQYTEKYQSLRIEVDMAFKEVITHQPVDADQQADNLRQQLLAFLNTQGTERAQALIDEINAMINGEESEDSLDADSTEEEVVAV